MAAVLGTRVWKFAVGDWAALTAAQLIQLKTAVKIASIYWLGPDNVGDDFSIVDNAGVVIQNGICEVAEQSQYFNRNNWAQGISNIVLDSGVLYINIY